MRKTILVSAMFGLSSAAHAQSTPSAATQTPAVEKAVAIEYSLAAVSDYRFRGLSLSNRRPALQPGVTLRHRDGAYAGAWASNVASNGGADVEVDLTAGWAGDLGRFRLDGGGVYYLYPGASAANYVELFGSVGTDVGEAEVTLRAGYAPAQKSLGEDNLYLAVEGARKLPGLPLKGKVAIGYEDGAFGRSKIDWRAEVTAEYRALQLQLAYVDTARSGGVPEGRAGLVLGVSASW